jgi:hypothetical protein
MLITDAKQVGSLRRERIVFAWIRYDRLCDRRIMDWRYATFDGQLDRMVQLSRLLSWARAMIILLRCEFDPGEHQSMTVESQAELTRIRSGAFALRHLNGFRIHGRIETLGSSYFAQYKCRSSISFKSNSRLVHIRTVASLPS